MEQISTFSTVNLGRLLKLLRIHGYELQEISWLFLVNVDVVVEWKNDYKTSEILQYTE